MSSLILGPTLFYSTLETFPTTIADNDPVQQSLIPHYHVKHLKWYFNDADWFFTQRGVLFGLHQHKFNNPHFSQRLNHIEPCRTAAIGTVSSLPISLDTLSILPFIAFIRLLYQPNDFSTDIIGWNQIKDLAMTWGFVDVTLRAMQKIQTTGSTRRSILRWFPLRTTVLTRHLEEEIIDDNSA